MIKAEELLDKIRSQNEVYNALKYHPYLKGRAGRDAQ